MDSNPLVKRRSSRLTYIPAAKAEPLTLRQRLQWHNSNGPATRATSKRTAPHRQLPRIMYVTLRGDGKAACTEQTNTTNHQRLTPSHDAAPIRALSILCGSGKNSLSSQSQAIPPRETSAFHQSNDW